MKEKYLKRYHILNVQILFADHYSYHVPGRIYHTNGNSDPSEMFLGGCIFIDHSIGYMIINHQVAISYIENIKYKITFERDYKSQIVLIKEYHTTNEIFNSS